MTDQILLVEMFERAGYSIKEYEKDEYLQIPISATESLCFDFAGGALVSVSRL